MSDFKTLFKSLTSGAEYNFSGQGIEEDTSLATAVGISIFTDKRNPQALPDDARGWWADGEIGSLRWTLSREKQTSDVLNRLVRYDSDALEWLKDAGLAKAVSVTAEWAERGILKEHINITLPNGKNELFLIQES
ncbi:phage GP46 family protein [Aliamphritea ceti]|uniref:phage GP46 family protein n=1 Tax=Aliamphritea ceti TaxID=1524258 RepID=UPI0021C36D45|nr:phage GP46 family protein [Aliamphritea ceti]